MKIFSCSRCSQVVFFENAPDVDFEDFEDLIGAWLPLTFALNSLNRGMGMPDIYPFVLSERALQKFRFVHDVIERAHASS